MADYMANPIDLVDMLRAREAELARVQRIGQIGGLEVDLVGNAFRNRRSPEYLRLHGLPPEAANESHESWLQRIHAEDRQRVQAHFLETLAGPDTAYEVEYRIVRPRDGAVRWILAKAEIERGPQGEAVRLVGAHIDITARRQAEEKTELVARELRHRIANIFTVVGSLIGMSARAEPGSRDFADRLLARIAALHAAHGFVAERTLEDNRPLVEVLHDLVAPYASTDGARVVLACPEMRVGSRTATALALVVHELATNAVKYGSLARDDGTVTLTGMIEGDALRLVWRERGGAQVQPPQRRGFGSTLVDRAGRSQLGATIEYDWAPEGLTVTLVAPLERLIQ